MEMLMEMLITIPMGVLMVVMVVIMVVMVMVMVVTTTLARRPRARNQPEYVDFLAVARPSEGLMLLGHT